jgi:glucokinase
VKRQAEAHPLFSSSALSKTARVDYEAIFRLSAQGDSLAKELLNRSLLAWATGAVNMVNSYDPEKFILGGGVMRSADIIVPFIQQHIRRRAWAQWEVPVVPAELGNDAGLLGIAYLAAHR